VTFEEIARVRLPYGLPYGFQGCWIPENVWERRIAPQFNIEAWPINYSSTSTYIRIQMQKSTL
jgi:hypothetical protein